MTWSRCVAILAFATAAPVALRAQGASLHPHASVLFVRPAERVDSARYPATHWKEGALIGGVPLGVLGFILIDGLCEQDDSADGGRNCALKGMGGAVLGFLVGAVPGALIGGSIPKHE